MFKPKENIHFLLRETPTEISIYFITFFFFDPGVRTNTKKFRVYSYLFSAKVHSPVPSLVFL